MAEKIVFPLNSEAYLRKGRIFFSEGKEEETLDCLSKAYELDNEIKTNIFYAFVLSHYERYEEALEIMNQEKVFYQNNETHASLYAKMLVKTQRFLEAEYIIRKYKDDPARLGDLTWEMLEQDFIQERERFNLEESARKEKIRTALRELKEYSHMAQIRKIYDAEILDLLDLQELAPAILVSADIGSLIKGALLEILSSKDDPTFYSLLWFNQIKEICPAKLPKFDEISLVHELDELMEKKLAKYPDLKVRVKLEIMHDLLLLYPYIEEIITDIEFWLDAYISELDFYNHVKLKRIIVTEEQKKMMKWIEHLNTISQRNQMFND